MINEKNRLTSLAYWFDKIRDLGIPVPKTVLIQADRMNILNAIEGVGTLDPWLVGTIAEVARTLGYPVFMRTDLCSAKHNWENTCFLQKEEDIQKNLFYLAEYNEMADGLGLPYKYIVLREFLELETSFTAFYGNMPINKERRYFIQDGKVLCHHPYWPKEAFASENDDIRLAQLDQLNEYTEDEITLLTGYAEKVGKVLPGFWSVDFAITKSGIWYLLDMAVGEASYHWRGCPNESMQVGR